MNLTTYLHLIPRLRMNGATLPLPMHVYMTCAGTNFPFLFVLSKFMLFEMWQLTYDKFSKYHIPMQFLESKLKHKGA